MQTKKKHLARNAARDSRSCRQQKKVSENANIVEKKVPDLITSSARRQRYVQVSAGILSKKCRDIEVTRNLKTSYLLAGEDTQDICLECDTVDESLINHKECNNRTAQNALETIFSPAFHSPKDGEIPHKVDVIDFCSIEDQREYLDCQLKEAKGPASESNAVITPFDEEYGGNLSSEVSAIYLAMQQSKLECINEQHQEMSTTDACVEADEDDENDDFDPYLFIRNLPDLSAVVPAFRPMLLPKQTRSCPPTTLVLDLDETLVHSTLDHCEDADFTFSVNFNFQEHSVYVRCRPHLKDFMERVSSLFEIIVFTASQSIYAEQLLNVLDPKRKIFRHRVYRESCVFVEGNYLKDLSVLGRDLARIIIIDNSPQAFGFQVDNGIPIESWFDDRSDQALLSLLPFLESLVGVEDVRPIIARRFNLREKVAAAVGSFSSFQ